MGKIRYHSPSRPNAELLRRLREVRHVTLQELSSRSGVPVSVLEKLEAGTFTNPMLSTLNSIARALTINTAQLLITDEPRPHNYELAEQLKNTGATP